MWVEDKIHQNIIPEGGIYTTVSNVELYFAQVISYRADITPDYAKRPLYALQRLANDERVGQSTKWEIKDNARVKEALESQALRYKDRINKTVIDPHRNLPTNTLGAENSAKAMHYVASNADTCNWQNLGICWNGSEQMFLRNDSMRKFFLTDLLTLDTHGPRQTGDYDRHVLGMIYRRGTHKDHQGRQRIVGAWRHLKMIMDFTTMVAMSLFVRFCAGGLDFRCPEDPNEKPAWWSLKLVEGWTDATAAASAYEKVHTACDIDWSKQTHLRSSSTEYASAVGELTAEEIATMTKHGGSKTGVATLLKHYITELFAKVLRVMSGFEKDNKDYRVWRTRFNVDGFCAQFGKEPVDFIFPFYWHWKEQQEGEDGDHSNAADNFINMTLPFLAKVVLQDGVYWIQNFPNHPAVRLLLWQMQGTPYVQFAQNCREWARQQQQNLPVDQMAVLEATTRNTVHALSNQFSRVEQRQDDLFDLIERNEIKHQQEEIKRQQEEEAKEQRRQQEARDQEQRQQEFFTALLQRQQAPPPASSRSSPARRQPPPRQQQQQQQPPPPVPPPPRQQGVAASLPIPPIPHSLPNSLRDFMSEHYLYRLDDYTGHKDNRRGWDSKTRNRFSVRMYLYGKIYDKAMAQTRPGMLLKQRLFDAADALDMVRGNRSLKSLHDWYKSRDPNRKTRQRKTRGEEAED
jgi:hypothetical protein